MRFDVKALHGTGRLVQVSVDAADADAAVQLALDPGSLLVSVRRRASPLAWREPRAPQFPLVLFSQELLSLLGAGLGLVEALEALAEKEQAGDVRLTLQRMLARLREGQALSAAMAQTPGVFPPLYVATVRASERTGALAEALGRYVAYQSQLDAVRRKIVNASIYPVLLLGVGALVVLFLMAYVVPRFAGIYESTNRDLPLLSRLLLEWGTLLHAHAAVAVSGFAAVLLAGIFLISRGPVRAALRAALWRVPALANRVQVYRLARLYRTLAMLLKGGVPLPRSLEMVEDILQPDMRPRLRGALQAVRDGRSVSQAMEGANLVTPVALRMLRVGERAGNMGDMMERIAAFHDEEMARWVDWATRLFEPLLMAFIGLVIGLIVVLMYLPVFELAGSLQ